MADLDIQSGQGPAGNKERWTDLTGGVYARVVSAVFAAGTAILGKVGIDQTTPGTTDSVTVSTAQGAGAAIGTTSGAAVITDANGTIPQYLRGIVTYLVTAAGGAVSNVAAATGFLRALGIRQYLATPPTLTDTRYQHGLVNVNGADQVNLTTLIAGEDQTNNRMLTLPKYTYSAVAVADVQIKASAGVLHSVTISPNDVLPTAGSIIIYDSLTETGTVVFNWSVPAAIFSPFTVILDYTMATGMYLGFTTTADVNVSCAYL